MSTMPELVQPGQTWKDNDERTKNSGEFTVAAVIDESGVAHYRTGMSQEDTEKVVRQVSRLRDRMTKGVAVVDRGEHLSVISTYRMLTMIGKSRGYTYLGMAR